MSSYPLCKTCHRPMRKGRHKAADHPGTISHKARGICGSCYYLTWYTPKPSKPKAQKQPIPVEADPATLASLSAYLRWRAPFRAKAGIQ